MLEHDLFDWTNAGVGAAGLVFTLGALWQAKGAKQAATEARAAIRERNTEDTLVEVIRLAESFADWVRYERSAEAVVTSREVVLRLARARGEFSRFIGNEFDNINNIETSCKRLADLLASKEFPLDSKEKHRLIQDASSIPQQLNAILGRIRARQEGK